MKLNLSRNVHNISLYKNKISLYKKIVLYYCCLNTFFAIATEDFHRLIVGKVKVGLFSISLEIF